MSDKNNRLKQSLGRFLTVLCDLMLLNILWIVCSLPILTMGPATCAMFSVMLKLVRDEDQGTLKPFFRAFKENFTNAFIFGAMILFAVLILYSDVVYALSLEGTMRIVFLIVSGILSAVVLTFAAYVFPLQARYENTRMGHIRNAFLVAFCAPVQTVLMWIIYFIPAALVLFLPTVAVAYLGSIILLFSVSGPVYFTSGILRKVFDRFVPGTGEIASQD